MMQQSGKVLGVQIGAVERIKIDGKDIATAIRKYPVTGKIAVNRLGLQGDEQADLTAHGGLAKAVYAYPAEHYAFWREQRSVIGLSIDLPYGSLGENLTLSGVMEEDLFVGDELFFPDCVLRVTQPREPCYKLNYIMEDRRAAKKMVRTGFCGFYLAVETPGDIALGQAFELRKGPREVPISALFKRAALKAQ